MPLVSSYCEELDGIIKWFMDVPLRNVTILWASIWDSLLLTSSVDEEEDKDSRGCREHT